MPPTLPHDLRRKRILYRATHRGTKESDAIIGGYFTGAIAGLPDDKLDEAERVANQYREIFGKDNFFLEIQDQGLDQEKQINPRLYDLSKKTGIPLVATNDVHFLNKADHESHDIMICIGTGASIYDQNRMTYSPEVYFKSAEEMRAYLERRIKRPRFAHGRSVRNSIDRARLRQANRLFEQGGELTGSLRAFLQPDRDDQRDAGAAAARPAAAARQPRRRAEAQGQSIAPGKELHCRDPCRWTKRGPCCR